VTDYRKPHIVTAGYLRRFSDGRLIQPVKSDAAPTDKRIPPRHPGTVGIRTDFYADSALAAEAEKSLNGYETRGIEALGRLKERWPLERGSGALDRLAISELVAVHTVRNPAFRHHLDRLRTANVARTIREGTLRQEAEVAFIVESGSERFAVEHLLSLVPKTASLIASAHWTLIEFPDRLLATSDQPVTIVPILPEGTRAPVDPAPRGSILFSQEFRFPVDPSHALLFTWAEGRDTPVVVTGTDDLAADLNRAVISQADAEWFHHPARRPTSLPMSGVRTDACSPIAGHLIPDYGPIVAAESLRRRAASEHLDTMIENEITVEAHIARIGVLPVGQRRFPTRHYHLDARTEPLLCEENPSCPVCGADWIGVRYEGPEGRGVADCVNDHRFAVKGHSESLGEPSRFQIGDQLTAPTDPPTVNR
jgi:Protein of unknown function (DUF4238)